jgi:hypothetical protein
MKIGYKVTIFDPNDKKETGSSLYQNPNLWLVETGEAPSLSAPKYPVPPKTAVSFGGGVQIEYT